MATSKITINVSIKKWAKPIIVLCFAIGVTSPRWCFNFEVSR